MSGTILLVDPDRTTRHCLAARLGQGGYRVLEAVGPEEAIGTVLERSVEVAVLDLTTLRRAGLPLLCTIRGTRPEIQILLITGRDQIQLAIRAMKLGAMSDVPAPLDVDLLLREVAAAVERFHEQRRSDMPRSLRDRLGKSRESDHGRLQGPAG